MIMLVSGMLASLMLEDRVSATMDYLLADSLSVGNKTIAEKDKVRFQGIIKGAVNVG